MADHIAFRKKLNRHLNLNELKVICLDLNIDYESLDDGNKELKINSLLRKTTAEEILALVQISHPTVNWTAKPLGPATLKPREREILINRVQSGWINGVLKKSLHERVKLELGLEYDFNLQGTVAERQNVEFGKQIGEIFDEAGRQLLILGEPGSGKTTTLLMLAEDLLERAKDDANEPIPLILNLSTWTSFDPSSPVLRKHRWQFGTQDVNSANQKLFEHWLGQAGFTNYTLNPDTTLNMLKNGEMILLLEALDEVGTEKMEECLQAINEVGLNEVVISSRLKDYEALETNLNITTAVHILPLEDDQVANYFSDVRFTSLKNVITANKELKELAYTPLMLNVMARAFEEASEVDLNNLQSHPDKVDFIFSKYVDVMFARKPLVIGKQLKKDSRKWLIFLADIMEKSNQATFSIYNIQPAWIPTKLAFKTYKLAVGAFFSILFSLLFFILFFSTLNPIILLSVGLSTSLIIGWLLGSAAFLQINLPSHTKLSIPSFKEFWGKLKSELFFWVLIGFTLGSFASMLNYLNVIQYGMIGILLNIESSGPNTGVFGELANLAFGNNSTLDEQQTLEMFSLMFSCAKIILGGIVFTLSVYIYSILIGYIEKPLLQDSKSADRNLSNALISEFLSTGLIFGVFLTLFGGWKLGLIGLILGSSYELIRYSFVRIVLQKMRLLPYSTWPQAHELSSFLNDMNDRLLIQDIGNQWKFIHRSLQVHLSNESDISWDRYFEEYED